MTHDSCGAPRVSRGNFVPIWIQGLRQQPAAFVRCLHGRRKKERLIVDVERKLDAVTDPGYSISAVKCPNCGSSFDALHKKECPYCGSSYRMDEDDWLITGIRKL